MVGSSSDESSIKTSIEARYQDVDFSLLYNKINPVLFKRFAGKPIIFYFAIDRSIVKKKYEEVVITFGGCHVDEYQMEDGMAAIMVEDNTRTKFPERPSFKVSYIIDCIKKNSLLNINDYVHHTFRMRDYMKIIFWESETFLTRTVVNYRDSSDSSDDDSCRTIKGKGVLKNTREMYTRCEKEAILKFLSKNKLEGLRGNSIWRTMEKRKVCPRRSYQSMKNHFLKTMIHELDKFDFLSETEKNKIRRGKVS